MKRALPAFLLLLTVGCGPGREEPSALGLDKALASVYGSGDIHPQALVKTGGGLWTRVLGVSVARDPEEVRVYMELVARKYGAEQPPVLNREGPIEYRVGEEILVVHIKRRPALAVVLDDFGHQSEPIKALAQLPVPLNIAVIPFLPYSKEAGRVALNLGNELLVHLPMQSEAGVHQEINTIHMAMTDDEVRQLTRKSLAELVGARGTNNHQGSLATGDARLMGLVMEELKARGHFFLDSRTSINSVAFDIAHKVGIESAKRNIFLDNDRKVESIRKQWLKGIRRARTKGEAVVIGHPYPETLTVLKEMLPLLKEKNIDLVRVSDLVK